MLKRVVTTRFLAACRPNDLERRSRPVSAGRERQVSGSRTFANAFAFKPSHSIGTLGPERPERPRLEVSYRFI